MSDSDSTSNVDTFATEKSFEVEDLLPLESSPVSQNHRGPEPYQFEPLAQQAAAGAKKMEDFIGVTARRVWGLDELPPKRHQPPFQPVAKFDCNSWILVQRGQSLLHFYSKIHQSAGKKEYRKEGRIRMRTKRNLEETPKTPTNHQHQYTKDTEDLSINS